MGSGAAKHHAQGGGHVGDSRVGVKGEPQGKLQVYRAHPCHPSSQVPGVTARLWLSSS